MPGESICIFFLCPHTSAAHALVLPYCPHSSKWTLPCPVCDALKCLIVALQHHQTTVDLGGFPLSSFCSPLLERYQLPGAWLEME